MKTVIKPLMLLGLAAIASFTASSQVKFGTNPTIINAGSILEMETTNKGLLYPRVSLAATTAWGLAGTAAAGMSVYNTNAGITGNATYPALSTGMYYFDGTGWVAGNAKAAEPWYNVATGTGATSNTQNIYQLGNVGIGTTQSTFKLNVLGTAQFGQTLAGAGMRIQTLGSYANIAGINHDNNTFNGLSFTTGASPSMYLTTSGDVGIGTSAPANKLEITQGTAGNSGLRFTNLPSAPVLGTNASGDVVASTLGAVSPIVYAASAADQVIPTGVWTKLTGITNIVIDNTSAMASDRFNPKVAGYYNVHATAYAPYVTAGGAAYISIFKNGAAALHSLNFGSASGSYMDLLQITGIVYMNGTTDYLEIYGYNGGTVAVTYYAGWSVLTANLIK
jgi:hypothetical protein